jgi:hypothetical protein
VQGEQRAPLAAGVAGRVDDDPPDPRFQRAAATVTAPFPHGLRERVLHGLLAKRAVTCDRRSRPAVLGSLRAVKLFEVVDHHPSDAPDEVDSLRLAVLPHDSHPDPIGLTPVIL